MRIPGKTMAGFSVIAAFGLVVGFAMAADFEDIPIVDPDQLAEMGFPPEADNVYERIYYDEQDEEVLAEVPAGFGPSDDNSTWAGRFFLGRDSTYQKRIRSGTEELYCSGGGTFNSETAEQEFRLPNGALITGIRWWAYDGTNADEVKLRIWRGCQPDFGAGATTFTNLTPGSVRSTGVAFNGGQFSESFSLPHTFDATSCYYLFQVNTGTCTSNLATGKIRIAWRRQISPAPLSATFFDVPPSHPFFDAIEALAASGITSGCGGSYYCPDQSVTRGQMAAFLARALGLQWANP